MSLVHVVTPKDRTGEAVGIRASITGLSQSIVPLAFGALGSLIGMTPLFWATAGFLGWGNWLARGEQRRHAARDAP